MVINKQISQILNISHKSTTGHDEALGKTVANLWPMVNIWCQHLQSCYNGTMKKLLGWLS